MPASGAIEAEAVLEPGRGKTKTWRFWCYAVDDRPWTGSSHPAEADRDAVRAILDLPDNIPWITRRGAMPLRPAACGAGQQWRSTRRRSNKPRGVHHSLGRRERAGRLP
jgi:hypothetical protein